MVELHLRMMTMGGEAMMVEIEGYHVLDYSLMLSPFQ